MSKGLTKSQTKVSKMIEIWHRHQHQLVKKKKKPKKYNWVRTVRIVLLSIYLESKWVEWHGEDPTECPDSKWVWMQLCEDSKQVKRQFTRVNGITIERHCEDPTKCPDSKWV